MNPGRGAVRRAADAIAAVAWYPAFMALSWTIQIVADRDVDPVAAQRSFLAVAIAALAITLLARHVVRDTPLAGALAAVAVLALLIASTLATVALFGLAAILLAIERWMERRGRLRLPWARIHETLTAVGTVILLVTVGQYAATLASRPSVMFDAAWSMDVPPDMATPNLYVVIADGHARADVLRELYDYDASAFVSGLERLGFDVAENSRANYMFTQLSLASFFSGSHLADLGQALDAPVDPVLLSSALRDNPATAFLRRIGYKVIAIPSGFDHVAERNVDEDLDTGQLSELEYVLLRTSALGTWLADAVDRLWIAAGADRTFANLDRLEQVSQRSDDEPRAAFVHLPLPHPPFAVDEHCRSLPLSAESMGSAGRDLRAGSARTVALEAAQTRCLDTRLLLTLEMVVLADPSAIVVLISDHGTEEHLDWWQPEADGLRERSACLIAVRTGGQSSVLPDDATLVNVLPWLFNGAFETRLPSRPDEVYFGPSPVDRTLDRVDP